MPATHPLPSPRLRGKGARCNREAFPESRDNPARRHPGQGREAAAEPGPIGRKIVEHGPVLTLARFRIVVQA